MPELPEVEVTRRGIDEPLRGARVLELRLGKPLRWPLGRDPRLLQGLTIAAKDLDRPSGGPKNPGECKIAGQVPCLCDGEVRCVSASVCNKLCPTGGRP